MGLKERLKIKDSEVVSFFVDILVIVIIVFIIKFFIIVPFVINGQSMYSSYYDREFIIVDKISYIVGKPSRGDVIVFRPEVDRHKEFFLKRIIGMPGDTLKIEDGKVYVKNKNNSTFIELQEKYLDKENAGNTYVGIESDSKVYNIGENEYFVMGDNRLHSTDSRQCFSNCTKRTEFITKKDMTGKVLMDLGYFNFFKLEFLHPKLGIETYPRFFSSPSTFTYKELAK